MMNLTQAADSDLADINKLTAGVAQYLRDTWHSEVVPYHYDDSDRVKVDEYSMTQATMFSGPEMPEAPLLRDQLTLGSVLRAERTEYVDPLHVLVRACIGYGVAIEAERNRRRCAQEGARA